MKKIEILNISTYIPPIVLFYPVILLRFFWANVWEKAFSCNSLCVCDAGGTSALDLHDLSGAYTCLDTLRCLGGVLESFVWGVCDMSL